MERFEIHTGPLISLVKGEGITSSEHDLVSRYFMLKDLIMDKFEITDPVDRALEVVDSRQYYWRKVHGGVEFSETVDGLSEISAGDFSFEAGTEHGEIIKQGKYCMVLVCLPSSSMYWRLFCKDKFEV